MSVLVKLGTVLNTVGSLGVGYYVGKFGIITNPDVIYSNGLFGMSTTLENVQLVGSVILLAFGLYLRIKDIRQRKYEKELLEIEVGGAKHYANVTREGYQDTIQNMKDAYHKKIQGLEDRLADTKGIIVEAVKPVVRDIVRDELAHPVLSEPLMHPDEIVMPVILPTPPTLDDDDKTPMSKRMSPPPGRVRKEGEFNPWPKGEK